MAFNVDTFKSRFSDGGARPNLFSVSLQTPGLVPNLEDGGAFEIKAAQIPSSTIAQVDVPYFGRQIRVAGNRTFEPWTVTVFQKEDFGIRNAMEQWMNGINGHTANTGFTNPVAYQADLIVDQLDKDGNVLVGNNYIYDRKGTTLWSDQNNQIISGIGLNDLIVV